MVPYATAGISPDSGAYRPTAPGSTGSRLPDTLCLPISPSLVPMSSSPSTSANPTPRFVATSTPGAILERGWTAPAPDGGQGSPLRYENRRFVPPPSLERGDLARRARESLRTLPGARRKWRGRWPDRDPPRPWRAAHNHHRRKARVSQAWTRPRPDRRRARLLSQCKPRPPRGTPHQRGGHCALRVARLHKDGTQTSLLRRRGRIAHDSEPR